MTQYLPPNLLALFAPRDPLPFLPPNAALPWEKKNRQYDGVAQYMKLFEDPKDTPPPTRVETKEERKERKHKERAEQIAYKLEQDLAMWDPPSDPNISGDPYKTLFVARINYDTSESKLRRELEVYGPIRRIKMVTDRGTSKPRGYAFVEYEHERDMHASYKHADGKKIDGRRILVDIERGRTIKGWRPRRLAGGLGGTRKGAPEENSKFSGRDEASSMAREREEREADRSRRSRSRGREDRGRRERSRERRRGRSKEREDVGAEKADEDSSRKRSRRSRSRDRPRRSRSRDRKRRRTRSRERRKEGGDEEVVVKEEPYYDEDAYGGRGVYNGGEDNQSMIDENGEMPEEGVYKTE